VYVGTELGVFYRNNNLGNWIPFSNYLPNAPVTDLKIFYGATRYLYASTYGRGMWYSAPYSTCLTNINLSTTLDGHKYWEAGNSITSVGSMEGNVGTEIFMKAGNFVQFNPGAVYSANAGEMRAWIGSCGSGGVPSMRMAGEALGIENPAGLFNQLVEPTSETISSPQLQYNGNGYTARFRSDGKQQCVVSLRGTDNETIGWFVKELLPEGNYQLRIPALPADKPFRIVIQSNSQRSRFGIRGAEVREE
jgi:hypothetical protein